MLLNLPAPRPVRRMLWCALLNTLVVLPAGAETSHRIDVLIVNDAGDNLQAGRLEWWQAGDPRHAQVARCKSRDCTQWQIDVPATSRRLELVAYRARANNTCWDAYRGTLLIPTQNRDRSLHATVRYSESVCA